MTAKGHLERAEQLLEQARNATEPGVTGEVTALALEAIGHGLAAIAIELGAPHTAGPGTEAGSA